MSPVSLGKRRHRTLPCLLQKTESCIGFRFFFVTFALMMHYNIDIDFAAIFAYTGSDIHFWLQSTPSPRAWTCNVTRGDSNTLCVRRAPFNSGFAQKARNTPRVSGGSVLWSLLVTIHSLRVRGVFACVFSCKNPSKTAFAHARRAFGMGKRKLLSQFRRDCDSNHF